MKRPSVNKRLARVVSVAVVAVSVASVSVATCLAAPVIFERRIAMASPQAPVVATSIQTATYAPLRAQRLLDTRRSAIVAPGATVDVLPGSAVPTGATALVINVTATATSGAGFVTAYPAGNTRPLVSNLNIARSGQTIANLVTVPTGQAGAVRFYSSAGTHLVVDLVGAYVPTDAQFGAGLARAGRLVLSDPVRVADTRTTNNRLIAGEMRMFQVLGRGGLPMSGVTAAVLNVTVTNTANAGWISVFACDQPQPGTSTLNPERSNQTVANQVIVPTDATGRVCMSTTTALDVVLDATGWFTDATATPSAAGLFVPLPPQRLIDTRTGPRLAPGANVDAIVPDVVADASALALNVTLTDATQAGFLTSFDSDTTQPDISTVNASAPGETIPNHAIVPSGSGAVRSYLQSGGHVIVDAFGWYTGAVRIATVGDLVCPTGYAVTATTCQHKAVSDMITGDPTVERLLALGDLQYVVGDIAEFRAAYEPTYGRLKDRTIPTPGNHEYVTPGAQGYFDYFGPVATPPATDGIRSVDVSPSWHVVVLNSNCTVVSCATSSRQAAWLRSDLAANKRKCTVAIWHHPRFSSGLHGNDPSTSALWDILREFDADLVLNGHDHAYERFAPMRSDGTADPARGIREFVVGTGGYSLYPKASVVPGSEFFVDTFGYLQLSLSPRGYRWNFLRLDGTLSDQGAGRCH
jgi:acid phosphatase type 7